MTEAVLGSLVIMVSSFVQATTGFGFAIVATPLMLLFLPPKSVIVIVCLLANANSAIRLASSWRDVDMKRAVPISIARVFGAPVGVYLLSTLDPNVIKLAVAVLVIPASIALLLDYSYHFKRQLVGCSAAGFLSGVTGASVGMAGPPLIVFLLGENMEKRLFVGTLSACFVTGGIITIGAFAVAGMVTAELLVQAAIALPVMALGFYIGDRVMRKLSSALFKRMAVFLVMASGVAVIVTVAAKAIGS